MTRDEFLELQKFIFIRLPDIRAWLAKIPEGDETLIGWFDILKHADFEYAKDAVRRLQSQVVPMPRGWSFLPATIRRIAAEIQQDRNPPQPLRDRYVGGERVYRCLQCRDSGLVECWHPESLAHLAREDREPEFPKLGSMIPAGTDIFGRPQTRRLAPYENGHACTCDAGAVHRRRGLRVFSERDFALRRRDASGEWVLHYTSDAEEIEAARHFVRERLAQLQTTP